MGSKERMRLWRKRQNPEVSRQKNTDYMTLYRKKKKKKTMAKKKEEEDKTWMEPENGLLQREESVPEIRGLADDDVYGGKGGEVKTQHLVFKHPFTALIAGPTGSGKTYWTTQLIEHAREMIDPPPEEIYWFYGTQTAALPDLQSRYGVKVASGLPRMDQLEEAWRNQGPLVPRLMILDDLMTDARKNIISNLFSRGSHHLNLSVMFIVQNIFHQHREMRNIFLNAQYRILFQNPGDATQLTLINNRMYPGRKNFLHSVMNDVQNRMRHVYIVLDTHPRTPTDLRVRSEIFPGEVNSVFVPRLS